MGPQDEAGLRRWVETALAKPRPAWNGRSRRSTAASGRAIGSSRFLSIVPEHRRLEIGWTWVGTAYQRTGANREAKLLQLTHAFETLGANRVEFKTHARNERSRNALAGIGATFEGVFRNHMVMPDGSIRHSAYFSVTSDEWPAIKARLSSGHGMTARPEPTGDPRTASTAEVALTWASRWGTLPDQPLGDRPDPRRNRRPPLGGTTLRGFIVGTVVTAIAFFVLTQFLPKYTSSHDHLRRRAHRARCPRVSSGVVNGLIGPIVKTLALPISMMTMGLVGFLINAGLLLVTAIIGKRPGST